MNDFQLHLRFFALNKNLYYSKIDEFYLKLQKLILISFFFLIRKFKKLLTVKINLN